MIGTTVQAVPVETRFAQLVEREVVSGRLTVSVRPPVYGAKQNLPHFLSFPRPDVRTDGHGRDYSLVDLGSTTFVACSPVLLRADEIVIIIRTEAGAMSRRPVVVTFT